MRVRIILAVLLGNILLMSGAANAAMYRVDFGGAFYDGTYDGYFTYDNPGYGPGETIYDGGAGLEREFVLNINFSAYTGSFDETTAGVYNLHFDDDSGELSHWAAGGNGTEMNIVGVDAGPDFLLSNYNGFGGFGFFDEVFWRDTTFPTWEVAEVSAVPLPAAAWVFGAGLAGLMALRRRKAVKALRGSVIQTA